MMHICEHGSYRYRRYLTDKAGSRLPSFLERLGNADTFIRIPCCISLKPGNVYIVTRKMKCTTYGFSEILVELIGIAIDCSTGGRPRPAEKAPM